MATENTADAYAGMDDQEARDEIEIWASRLTEKTIFEKDVIRRLEETRDAITYGRIRRAVRKQAKALGIMMKDIDDHFKACEVDKFTPKPGTNYVVRQNVIKLHIKDGTRDEDVVRQMWGWYLEKGKVLKDTERGPIKACRVPIMIVRHLRDRDDGTEFVELAWQKPNEKDVRTQIVPQASIASKSEILRLAATGVPAESDVAGALVSFLADMGTYDTEIQRLESTGQMGWSEDMKHFAPYDDHIVFYDREQSALSRSVNQTGTYEDWLGMIKRVRKMDRIEPLLCLAASFAAPIVQMVNGQTGMVNLARESGLGKSVSMACGASIYGEPERGAYMIDAGSTANFSEGVMETLKNLPAFFDDLSQATNPVKAVTELVMKVCGDSTKGRKSKDIKQRRILKWKTIAQINFERDITSLSLQGGVINRVYEFQCDPGIIFDDRTTPTSTEVITTLMKNHGIAGKKWIDILKDIGASELKRLVDEKKKHLRDVVAGTGGIQKSGKQLALLAIILVADELSAEKIFQDKILLPEARMLEDCKSETDVFEPAKAYEIVGDLVTMNITHFEADSAIDRFGKLDGTWVDINPQVLRKWALDNNFSERQLCKWLLTVHPDLIQVTEEPGKNRLQKRVPRDERDGGGQTYVYRIKLWQYMDGEDGDEVTEEQATRAQAIWEIYDSLPDEKKDRIYTDDVIKKFLLDNGFEVAPIDKRFYTSVPIGIKLHQMEEQKKKDEKEHTS